MNLEVSAAVPAGLSDRVERLDRRPVSEQSADLRNRVEDFLRRLPQVQGFEENVRLLRELLYEYETERAWRKALAAGGPTSASAAVPAGPSLETELIDSLRSGYLFGNHDEPLDAGARRVVRVIQQRLYAESEHHRHELEELRHMPEVRPDAVAQDLALHGLPSENVGPSTPPQLAEKLAREVHAGQKEPYGGAPYIQHIERVVALVRAGEETTVAWLHDVIEDTPITADRLLSLGFEPRIVDAVVFLTRTESYDYATYIDNLRDSGNALAIAVKIADLRDHLRPNCPTHLRARYEAALLALASGAPPFDFLAHLQRQRDWSGQTFGPGPRAAGVLDHIRKELREIEANPTDISEWIDVTILALDGAWRAGFQPQDIIDALVAKQAKNEARSWPDWRTAPVDKAIEHDRVVAADAPTPQPDAAPISISESVRLLKDAIDKADTANGAHPFLFDTLSLRDAKRILSAWADAGLVDGPRGYSTSAEAPTPQPDRVRGAIDAAADALFRIPDSPLVIEARRCIGEAQFYYRPTPATGQTWQPELVQRVVRELNDQPIALTPHPEAEPFYTLSERTRNDVLKMLRPDPPVEPTR